MKSISAAVFTILLFVTSLLASDKKWVELGGEIDPSIPARGSSKVQRQPGFNQDRSTYPWKMRPGIYGFTEPASRPVRYLAERSTAEGVMLGWPSYVLDSQGHSRFPEILEIIRNGIERMKVSIVAAAGDRLEIENALRSAGVEPYRVEIVSFPHRFPDQGASNSLDTIWIRDYGPVFVYSRTADGLVAGLIDMSYYPHPWHSPSVPSGRVRDDAVPTRLAELFGRRAFRPRLIGEGGNLQTDGRGTCFTSSELARSNKSVFGGSYRFELILKEYFGCNRTIVLQALKGEPTGHVDMFLTVVSPDTILIGSYDFSSDPANAAILNENARLLKVAGYRVIRIPMPEPYSIGGIRVWATFANSLRINDALLVPVYRNPKFPRDFHRRIRSQEAEAIQRFQEALPGVKIIPVVSDSVILYGGALHCIAVAYSLKKP